MGTVLMEKNAGIEMLHVPYRGAGPALNDLIPGRVDVMFNNIGAVLPLIQGRAHVTLDATLLFDPADPFAWGLG